MADGCALVAVVGDDLYPCRSHEGYDHHFTAHWPACPAPFCKLTPGHRELHDIPYGEAGVVEAGVMSVQDARIRRLEAVAREMLAAFIKTSDGYRARVGQVQIAKWQKRIEGTGG